MNTALFNYIFDAMSDALKIIDNNIEYIESEQERNKLKKASDLFYDWYQTAWEHPIDAVKIKP